MVERGKHIRLYAYVWFFCGGGLRLVSVPAYSIRDALNTLGKGDIAVISLVSLLFLYRLKPQFCKESPVFL